MDSALFRRWAKSQFDGLRGLPVLYVISQRGLERTKIGLTTDWEKRIGNYRTALVEFDVHAILIPRLELLDKLEKEFLKMMVKRILHTRHPSDRSILFSEWSAEPPEDVIARLQDLKTPVIAGWTFTSKKAKRFLFHKQEAGAFPRTRFGREIKTRTVLVADGPSRYKIQRVSSKFLSPVEEVAYYRFAHPLKGTIYIADGDEWTVTSVSLYKGEASATVKRGGEPEVWAPVSQIAEEIQASARGRRK